MSIYEVYLPVADDQGVAFAAGIFRTGFDELADRFGLVETWPVYRPLRAEAGSIIEAELYRYQLDVPDTDENRSWMLDWRHLQDQRFSSLIWLIRYRRT